MIIKELQLRKYPYKYRKGLSEKLVKRYFQKLGYSVYRGTLLHAPWSEYENVINAYLRIQSVLEYHLQLRYYQFIEEIQNGLPDFICIRKKEILFIEVKLEQESIKAHQQVCLQRIESYGFTVMVIRMKSRLYRVEKDFLTNTVLVKQKKLKLHW